MYRPIVRAHICYVPRENSDHRNLPDKRVQRLHSSWSSPAHPGNVGYRRHLGSGSIWGLWGQSQSSGTHWCLWTECSLGNECPWMTLWGIPLVQYLSDFISPGSQRLCRASWFGYLHLWSNHLISSWILASTLGCFIISINPQRCIELTVSVPAKMLRVLGTKFWDWILREDYFLSGSILMSKQSMKSQGFCGLGDALLILILEAMKSLSSSTK